MHEKAIVSDWDDTLFTGETVYEYIGNTILSDFLKEGRFLESAKILGIKIPTVVLYGAYKAGLIELKRVFNSFNPSIKGKNAQRIRNIADAFAENNENKVDGRMLRPISDAHRAGKRTAILSNSYDYGIRKLLERSGYDGVFDEIIGNSLEESNSIAIRFGFDICGRKHEILESEFFDKKNIRPRNLLYVGDSKETSIANILPKGNYIVPLCCPEAYKQRMAKEGAFVAEDERDLRRYLQWKNFL